MYLRNVHIPEYEQGSWTNHEPRRTRKLLLHREEIVRLIGKTKESGLTIVPLSLYFSAGKAKVELGLARGKKSYDKRQDLARRDADREVARAWAAGTRAWGEPATPGDARAAMPTSRAGGGSGWGRMGAGLIDIHTHFMPKPVMDAVWRYFDDAERHYGTPWPVHYRGTRRRAGGAPARARGGAGSPRWSTRTSPGWPSRSTSGPGLRRRACRSAWQPAPSTPRRRPAAYVRDALEAGTGVFKVHVQVGAFDPRDPTARRCGACSPRRACRWWCTAAAGRCRVGTPAPGPFGDVLAAHPRLTAVIAHCGAPEFAEHLELVARYPNVHVDTTMVGTEFMNRLAPVPADVLPRLADARDRVVLGTDFPNIPYAFAEQLERARAVRAGRGLAARGLLGQRPAPARCSRCLAPVPPCATRRR